MRADFYVYALFREDGTPFYIGKGRGDRIGDHEREARAGRKGHRWALIRKMQRAGIELPKCKLHEGLTNGTAQEYEIALIHAIGRGPHGPLVNLTDGGEGNTGWDPGTETRAKMGAAARGRVPSVETRAKRSAVRKGKTRPPETGERIAAALRGKAHTPERRAAMSAAAKQRVLTAEGLITLRLNADLKRGVERPAETRAKISAGLTGIRRTPEQNAANAAARIGKKASAETRAKMSAARKGKPMDPEVRAARFGRVRSPEAIQATATAHRGRKRSSGACERMRQAHARKFATTFPVEVAA
jgi:hypothetical protein